MGLAEVRRLVRSREEMVAMYGDRDEKTATDRFEEDNDAGAELSFIDGGVAIWLTVGDRDGDDYILRSLGRAEIHYPFPEETLLDVLDSFALLYEGHCRLLGMAKVDMDDLTATAKGLQGLGDDDDRDDQVALEQLATRVTCGKCGRPAPVLLHVIEFTDLFRLDVDMFERDTTDLGDGRGEQISLTACCLDCDHKWSVNVNLGELL